MDEQKPDEALAVPHDVWGKQRHADHLERVRSNPESEFDPDVELTLEQFVEKAKAIAEQRAREEYPRYIEYIRERAADREAKRDENES